MDDLGSHQTWTAAGTTHVHRHLGIDHRTYEVTAFHDGQGVVEVSLTAWGDERPIARLAGEVPAVDAVDVGHLLAGALAAFRDPPPRDPVPTWPVRDPRDHRAAYPNAGKPWEPADLDLLVARFQEGASVDTLTTELGRTEGGIRSRLQIMGITRPPADAPPGVSPVG